jgi:hypothetical protein
LAKDVAIALLTMPENDPEAKKANYAGWTVPLDYSVVRQLFMDLNAGPYEKPPGVLGSLGGDKNFTMFFFVGLSMMFLCVYFIWSPIKRLKQTTDEPSMDSVSITAQGKV